MNKIRSFLIVIIVLSQLCQAYAEEKKKYGEVQLYGKIKSFREITTKVKTENGKKIKISISRQKDIYNENGDVIETITYTFAGNISSRQVFKYNEKGTYAETDSYNSNGNLEERNVYKYNNGNHIETDIFNSNGNFIGKNIFKYDTRGKLIEENYYGVDEGNSRKIIYKYDIDGNRIEMDIYSNDEQDCKWTFNYDKQGNCTEQKIIMPDGSINSIHSYKYDNKKNLIAKNDFGSFDDTEFGNLSMNHGTNYKYDNKGNIIEEIKYDQEGGYQEKNIYKYDDKGNQIEQCSYDSESKLTGKLTCKYDFDSHQNWIKKISIYNNELSAITIEREIEYYD